MACLEFRGFWIWVGVEWPVGWRRGCFGRGLAYGWGMRSAEVALRWLQSGYHELVSA